MHLAGPYKIEYRQIPSGVDGTIATLQEMRRIVREAKSDMAVRDVAQTLIQHNLQKDFTGEMRSIFNFVKKEIRYVKDPRGVEMVQSPRVLLRTRSGDCDDKSVLLASLLESIGHATRFVAVGRKVGSYSHVYVEVLAGQNWTPLETTEPVNPGWSPKKMASRLVVYN